MTICFCLKSQNCRRCPLFVPEELSGMPHGTVLSLQLHKRSQKGFWHMTQAGFLTSLHLKHRFYHRESVRVTGKIVHLSLVWFPVRKKLATVVMSWNLTVDFCPSSSLCHCARKTHHSQVPPWKKPAAVVMSWNLTVDFCPPSCLCHCARKTHHSSVPHPLVWLTKHGGQHNTATSLVDYQKMICG